MAGFVLCGTAGARLGGAALWTYPAASAASVLLLIGSLGADLSILPPMVRAALTKAGQISYGLYIFHALAFAAVAKMMHTGHPQLGVGMFFLQTILVLALTLAVSLASYRYLEGPFLRLKARFAHVATGNQA